MKTFKVTDNMIIEALSHHKAEEPLVCIKAEDYPEDQVVIVFAKEIRHLIDALTEAAVWLANEATKEATSR